MSKQPFVANFAVYPALQIAFHDIVVFQVVKLVESMRVSIWGNFGACRTTSLTVIVIHS